MVSQVQVSFKDQAGRICAGDLASVSAAQVAGSLPWRVFRSHKGQAHYSGWYFAATTGGHVVYESRLELARLLLADFDPMVCSIAAQPCLITAEVGGRARRHVPDFLLSYRDGAACVVNVKPRDQLSRPAVAEALGWAGEVFAQHGWRHEVWSGMDPVVLANIRFLAGYRHAERVDHEALRQVEHAVTGCARLAELEAGDSRLRRPAALHLLWRGVLRTDLSVPLSGASVLERAA